MTPIHAVLDRLRVRDLLSLVVDVCTSRGVTLHEVCGRTRTKPSPVPGKRSGGASATTRSATTATPRSPGSSPGTIPPSSRASTPTSAARPPSSTD